ncbi:hypothetical protein [Streptomyces sp. NPDC094472]|uniref:hypothetical protein n=1 Tax=unclassified Streptomyces TaxID=2593676 RepID=UPI003325FB9C
MDRDLFDLVCIDYYSWFPGRFGHIRELRTYQRHGKPLAITEFGSCTFEGAPRLGGESMFVSRLTAGPGRRWTQSRNPNELVT